MYKRQILYSTLDLPQVLNILMRNIQEIEADLNIHLNMQDQHQDLSTLVISIQEIEVDHNTLVALQD